jgi:RNA polymerase sigma-70 factor (ECF subfamily)
LATAPTLEEGRAEGDEAALVQAARSQPAAFDALYGRYRARLYWYLRTRTTTDEDAADLTQQVFLQVWDALPGYRERGLPFAAWLFRIARNAAANAARKRRDTVAWEALPDHPARSTGSDPEQVALHNESLTRLRALLHTLDAEKQELLALRFAAGLTAREIASVIGAREEAVKKRLSRTIRALKEQFDEA